MPPRISLVVEELEHLLQLLAGQAGPVHVHRRLDDRMRHDGRRPFDRVNLGHQRRVDQLAPCAYSWSSVHSGCSCASRSQMWLCSSVNSVWSMARPIHQLSVNPLKWMPVSGSTGSSPVGSILSLPPSRPQFRGVADRSRRSATRPTSGCSGWRRPAAASIPAAPGRAPSAEPSSSGDPSRRRARAESRCRLRRGPLVHEPVVHHELNPGGCQQVEQRRRLELVAVISSRLTTRGLGLRRLAASGKTCCSGKFRPKLPAAPMAG